ETGNPQTFWLFRLLYRSILASEQVLFEPDHASSGKANGNEVRSALSGIESTVRYRKDEDSTRTILSTAVPIVHDDMVMGAVVARQSSEQYLSLTDRAFSKLLGYSLLALAVGAFGLLGYASLLSWRIGRLNLAARRAIEVNDPTQTAFPRSTATDEIGELSRSYADLLDQLHEYNAYLRTLSRKLSHELRTPIAVIQSSLDNLDQSSSDSEEAAVYMVRARAGLQRLNGILTAMSEASRLEDSIRGVAPQELDLVPLVQEMFNAYQSVYAGYHLHLDLQPETAMVKAVPELLVQALDKLVENATSFCPPEGEVCIALQHVPQVWLLSVSNPGPALPKDLRERLFDPMVSMRTDSSDEVHLGLGLHIVRLIAESVHGRVSAENLPDDSGVKFTFSIPASATGETP
ncbi:MAG: ATP-binding protein, partial [Pseudomonadota bacterium]